MKVNAKIQKFAKGFTLLEIMIAVLLMVLVSVGLLGLFSNTLLMMQYAKNDLTAREKARQALEMILSAKTTGQLTFQNPDNLENVGSGSGVFLTGWQPLLIAGPDGLLGTADDGCASTSTSCITGSGAIADSYVVPGANGSVANTAYPGQAVPAGASVVPLSNFQRQILIGAVTPGSGSIGSGELRMITVTVRYPQQPNGWRNYTVVSYVSSFQ